MPRDFLNSFAFINASSNSRKFDALESRLPPICITIAISVAIDFVSISPCVLKADPKPENMSPLPDDGNTIPEVIPDALL